MDDSVMRKLTVATGVVILVTFAISFVVGIFNPAYEPPASIHALMVIVAGGLFGENVFRARRKAEEDEPEVRT